jgi:hypothetical protein
MKDGRAVYSTLSPGLQIAMDEREFEKGDYKYTKINLNLKLEA